MFAYGFIYLLVLAVLSFQIDDLPPLTVTQYGVDDSLYYVVDVQTGEATPVQRPERQISNSDIFIGYAYIRDEIAFHSPYDESLAFVLVNQQTDVEDYSLYRVTDDGSRVLIAEHAWTGLDGYWSPDGRYLYITTLVDQQPSMLHRYDLQSGEMTAVANTAVRGFNTCDPSNQWYTFRQSVEGDTTAQLTSLIDKNKGELWEVGATEQTIQVQWIVGRPEFLYVATKTDGVIIRRYDYAAHTSEMLVELPPLTTIQEMAQSPDGRWLALHTYQDTFFNSDLVVIDLTSANRTTVQLNSEAETPGLIAQFALEWVGEHLLFDMQQGDDRAIYRWQAGETPQQLIAVEAGAFVWDYSLSPDQTWLALLLKNPNNGRDQRLTIIPVAGGEPRDILPPLELEEISCIGWFEEAASMSREAYLCDKYWGIG